MLFIDPADNRLTSGGKQQAGRGGRGRVLDGRQKEGGRTNKSPVERNQKTAVMTRRPV